MPERFTAARRLHVAVLLFALTSATTMALLRPAFQVSDEVNYLASIRARMALDAQDGRTRWPTTPVCAALGANITYSNPGRPLFAWAVAPLLDRGCALFSSTAAGLLFARAMLGIGMVIMAAAAWRAAAWLGAPAALAACIALIIAAHPVLTTYQAAITPDALANPLAAASAAALIGSSAARGAGRLAWLAVAMAGALAAAMAKDTALGMALVVLAAGPFVTLFTWKTGGRRTGIAWGQAALASAWLGLLTLGTWVVVSTAGVEGLWRYQMADVRLEADALPEVGRTLWRALPRYHETMALEIGNFGGMSVRLPGSIALLSLAFIALGLAGLVVMWRRPPSWLAVSPRTFRILTVFFGVAVAFTLLQPPARNVATGVHTAIQGRWLFPIILPAVLWLTMGLCTLVRPGRVLPLSAVLGVSVAWVTLAWTLLPHYYAEVPSSYARSGLFLRGSYGVAIDPSLLAPLLARPGWLGEAWFAWSLLGAVFASGIWVIAEAFRLTRAGSAA